MIKTALPLYRSMLFVPAMTIERVHKAFNCGADMVIIDWEDSVSPANKVMAHEKTLDFLQKNPETSVWIRINAADTAFFEEDLVQCKQLLNIIGILVPKIEHQCDIEHIYQILQKPIIGIIESVLGFTNIPTISQSNGLYRLTYGVLDISLALGSMPNTIGGERIMDQLRIQLLLHSALNNLPPPLDTIYPDFHDINGLTQRAKTTKEMGMHGMLCIHPNQLEAVNRIFTPSQESIQWAKSIVNKAQETGDIVFQFEGKMIDAPAIQRAHNILALINGK